MTLTQQLQEKAVREFDGEFVFSDGCVSEYSTKKMKKFITKLVADVVEAEKSRALNVMKTQEDRWCEDEFGHCGCLRYAIDLVENPEADRIFTPSTQPKEVQP